jgi:hypothetical protein
VIVTVVYPEESVTEETPDPAKLRPVIPVPTRAPLKNVFIAEALPVAAFGKYSRSFHGFIPSPNLALLVSVSYPISA